MIFKKKLKKTSAFIQEPKSRPPDEPAPGPENKGRHAWTCLYRQRVMRSNF